MIEPLWYVAVSDFFQQAVLAQPTGGEFIEIGNFHRVAGCEFQRVIVGEFQNVLCRWDVNDSAAGDLHVADGDRFAAVFEELDVHVAKRARR